MKPNTTTMQANSIANTYAMGYQAGWAAAVEAAARMMEDELGDVHETRARAREVRSLFAKIDYI